MKQFACQFQEQDNQTDWEIFYHAARSWTKTPSQNHKVSLFGPISEWTSQVNGPHLRTHTHICAWIVHTHISRTSLWSINMYVLEFVHTLHHPHTNNEGSAFEKNVKHASFTLDAYYIETTVISAHPVLRLDMCTLIFLFDEKGANI